MTPKSPPHANDYLRRAIEIRKAHFSNTNDLGVIRVRENESYRRNRQYLDPYLINFVRDLNDLFPHIEI